MAGCPYHEYQPSNPDGYVEYWCDPSNIEDSLVNVVTDKYNEEDLPTQQECIQGYNQGQGYSSP